MNKPIEYVLAECRPSTDADGYADICLGDDSYIFAAIEPCENLQVAMLIANDIDRTKPQNKYIVLHHQSLAKLFDGIMGEV